MFDIKKEKKKRALGHGLSMLLSSEDLDFSEPVKRQLVRNSLEPKVINVDINLIKTNDRQPRTYFDTNSLDELASSIKTRGLLSPLLVTPLNNGVYELIAGERRLRACMLANILSVPVIIMDVDVSSVFEIAIIENIQRENLNPIDEASGYSRLIEEFGYTQEKVAGVVGKSRSHIANMMRVLDLPPSIQMMVKDGSISMGHARSILKAPNPIALAAKIVSGCLSVRQAEKMVRQVRQNPACSSSIESASGDNTDDEQVSAMRNVEKMLSEALSLEVKLKNSSVVIHYKNFEELDRIMEKLAIL